MSEQQRLRTPGESSTRPVDEFAERFRQYEETVYDPVDSSLDRFRSSNEYEQWARAIHTTGPWRIYVCKDGTFTIRESDAPDWTGLGVPMFGVPDENSAIALRHLMCFLVDAKHPLLPSGEDWYKLSDVHDSPHYAHDAVTGERGPCFHDEDRPRISAKIRAVYRALVTRPLEPDATDLLNLTVCPEVWGYSPMVAPKRDTGQSW